MPAEPHIPTLVEQHAYAMETHRMAMGMYDLIFPPWRFRKWLRTKRVVEARLAQYRAWRAAAEAEPFTSSDGRGAQAGQCASSDAGDVDAALAGLGADPATQETTA